jgi:hypothetical protein
VNRPCEMQDNEIPGSAASPSRRWSSEFISKSVLIFRSISKRTDGVDDRCFNALSRVSGGSESEVQTKARFTDPGGLDNAPLPLSEFQGKNRKRLWVASEIGIA